MGYNPKTTYCNLAELEKGGGGVANNSAIFGSSNFEEVRAKRESFVDLKLGRLGDFGTGLSKSALMDPFSSSAGSSKRPRTPSIGGHIVSCSVDGCKADLSKCRDYHRRHKVCEMHSKTSKVTIGGHEQRFCQQCSRFHSLGEFDEGKRSCRKRLEGHNRRRRKPQPEPRPMNAGNFFSVSEGSRFLPFSSQPVIPATSMVNTYWSSAVKSETNPAIYTNSETSSYSNPYKGRQFPFLQPPEPDHTLHHDGSSTSNNNNNQKMFCNEINQLIDSDRALSLLSSSPSETPDMGLNRIIHSNPSTTVNRPPLLPSLHLDGFAPYAGGSQHTPGFQGRPENSALLPDLRNNNNNNSLCQDVFQNRSDGSSTSGGGYQTLSFNWE